MNYKREIGKRISEAIEISGLKLREIAKMTEGLLSISKLNNYKHGTRMLGPAEAVLLGRVLGKRPAYFLGVDDVQLEISKTEEALVKNWRALNERDRMELYRKLELMAMSNRDPVQDQIVAKSMGAAPEKKAQEPRQKRQAAGD